MSRKEEDEGGGGAHLKNNIGLFFRVTSFSMSVDRHSHTRQHVHCLRARQMVRRVGSGEEGVRVWVGRWGRG